MIVGVGRFLHGFGLGFPDLDRFGDGRLAGCGLRRFVFDPGRRSRLGLAAALRPCLGRG